MTKRNLTDELQSVLLARSFDAPDPDDTVRAILAATVGEGEPVAVASASSAPAGRRRQPRGRWLAVAAAAVVVAGLGTVVVQNWPTAGSGSSSSAAGSGTVPAAGKNDTRVPSRALAGGEAASSPFRAGASAADNGPLAQLTSGPLAGCAVLPGGQLHTGQATRFTDPATGGPLTAVEYLCVADGGARSASEVQVTRSVDGADKLVATVLPASSGRHLASMTPDAGGLQLRYTAAGPTGVALYQVQYPAAGGLGAPLPDGALVASGCTASQLTADLRAAGTGYLLQLRNRGVPCVIEGYPQVGGGQLRAAATGTQVAPVVLLPTGGTASARLDVSTATAGCTGSAAGTVALPSGSVVADLPSTVGICSVQVHPVVRGLDGSG